MGPISKSASYGYFSVCARLNWSQSPVLLLQTCFNMAASEAAKAKKLRKEPVHKHAPYIEVRCILRHSELGRCISSCSTTPLCR